MDITKKIVNIVLLVITAFATIASCVLIYYKTLGKDKVPSAVTSSYLTTVTDPLTGEEHTTIEANYYSNKNGKGYEVVELLFNCYSGVGKQAIYSRGLQLVTADGKSTLYHYDKYAGASFVTGHEYKEGDKMVFDINGKTYGVALTGKYKITERKINGWKLVRTIGFVGLNFIFEDTKMYTEKEVEYTYTFEELLEKVSEIIKSCSNGTGDHVISLVDLGDFLEIYDYDEESGQFSGEPVGKNSLANSYFSMSAHFDNRGMVWAKQSLFNSVAGDSAFNISGISNSVDYWKATTEYNLSEADFTARYLVADSGFYYSLPTEKINEIKNFENVEINITFDVSAFNDINVLGFDYYALYGIKVNSLTIKCDTQRDFKLMVGSLKDTGLTCVNTNNINIININSGVSL